MKKFKVGDRVLQVIYPENPPVGIVVSNDSYPFSIHEDSVAVKRISEGGHLTVWAEKDLELDTQWYREQQLIKLI